MKNDFILHVMYEGDRDQENIIKSLLSREEVDGDLISAKKINDGNEIFYRIRIRPVALSRFKKMLDKAISITFIELFEFRLW